MVTVNGSGKSACMKMWSLEWMAVAVTNGAGVATVKFSSPKPEGKDLRVKCETEARSRLGKTPVIKMEWANGYESGKSG